MTEIRFYHLTQTALDQALPELLEKTLERGKRAIVKTSSPERAEALAQILWTYKADSFLPHGTVKDGAPQDQPIWLTSADENPNEATFLFLTDGATAQVDGFERVCLLFDGNDPTASEDARAQWRSYKTSGATLSYWQQGERGWTNKVEGDNR